MTERALKRGPKVGPKDVTKLRERYPELTELYSDKGLEILIEDAKAWIGGIRWSWIVVTANFLKDGHYHA